MLILADQPVMESEMPKDPQVEELMALVKHMEQDAFQRGWDAAVDYIMSAAASAPKGGDAFGRVTTTQSPPQARRSSYGIVPALVREVLDDASDTGIVPADVVARGRERGEEIAESSVRQRLRKMKIAGEVRNARGRWFRVRSADEATRQGAGDVSASPAGRLALDDGGYHAAA